MGKPEHTCVAGTIGIIAVNFEVDHSSVPAFPESFSNDNVRVEDGAGRPPRVNEGKFNECRKTIRFFRTRNTCSERGDRVSN